MAWLLNDVHTEHRADKAECYADGDVLPYEADCLGLHIIVSQPLTYDLNTMLPVVPQVSWSVQGFCSSYSCGKRWAMPSSLITLDTIWSPCASWLCAMMRVKSLLASPPIWLSLQSLPTR